MSTPSRPPLQSIPPPSQSPMKKRSRAVMEKEIHNLKETDIQQRETIRENACELEILKDRIRALEEAAAEAQDGEPERKKTKDNLDTQFMRAGKNYAFANYMWLSPGVLDIVQSIAGSADEAPTDADMPEGGPSEKLMEEAMLIYKSLPQHLKCHATDRKLLKAFKDGHAALKSTDAHNTATYIAHILPDIPPQPFLNRDTRADIPEVQRQLSNNQFLYDVDWETANGKKRVKAHMRGPALLSVLRGVLFGPTAMTTGKKSSKAKKCNAILWNVTSVNDEMLAYAATLIKFVLSGDHELSEKTDRNDFKQFYNKRLDLLSPNGPSTITQRCRREELLQYYNKAVFPEHHTSEVAADCGWSHEEEELWKAMQEAEDDEENETTT